MSEKNILKNKLKLFNHETGLEEEFQSGNIDKQKSKIDAKNMFDNLKEKERISVQLRLLKEKVLKLDLKEQITSEDEKDLLSIYETAKESDDVNFMLGMYYFSKDNIVKGILYLKKSLQISNKYNDDLNNFIDKILIAPTIAGTDITINGDAKIFLKEFRSQILIQVKEALGKSEKKNIYLYDLMVYLERLGE